MLLHMQITIWKLNSQKKMHAFTCIITSFLIKEDLSRWGDDTKEFKIGLN